MTRPRMGFARMLLMASLAAAGASLALFNSVEPVGFGANVRGW